MQIIISDLVELEAYVSALQPRIPGLTHYKYLGHGDEFDNAIQSYFNNQYVPGSTVLFLGIFEGMTRDTGGNQSLCPMFCQVSILTKADPKTPMATLQAKNETWKKTLKLVGTIELDMEESQSIQSSKRVRIEIDQNKIIPLEKIANVNAWGWGTEIIFSIPVNSIKY